jgi:hypothetical protein
MRLGRFHVYPTDGVIRVPGPLRARVTIEAQNKTRAATGHEEAHYAALYNYTLDIPAGQIWQLPVVHAGPLTAALGANDGVRVVVDPAPDLRELVPPILAGRDLPCELGVSAPDEAACSAPRPSCDHAPPGAMVAMPPDMPALITTPARGGLVATRYFNGLFMTHADLETQQRRLRSEQQLQNRAHGAGVVWGLVPSFNGRSIKVGVGYGVDCCGNDLLVTSAYEVPVGALFADAGVQQQTNAGFHLLLEYVETPEAPRPVHDECTPGISRSEPSRIRETVRLRLVAPREFDGRGPIDELLATGLIDSDQVAPQPDIPFDLWVRLPGGVVMDFALGTDGRQITVNTRVVDLETHNKPDWTLTAATVMLDVDPSDAAPPVKVAELDPATGTVKWRMEGTVVLASIEWRGRHSGVRGTYAGTTRIWLSVEIDTQEMRLSTEDTVVAFTPDAPGPCAHEPCSFHKTKRFPTEPPWIHGFPDAPDTAADPRVLELALSELGITDASGVDVPTQYAIRDLLGAWCNTLLWRGPGCVGPLPHGIVIGCATVQQGRLVEVDPWGGRRWVGRPALLDHVAGQLGVTPPDLVMSRLASLACCAAAQPVPEPTPVILERRPSNDTAEPLRRRVERLLLAHTPPLPPLLRDFATRLAATIARTAPIDALPGIETPVAERLRAGNVATVGDLLAGDPDEILAAAGPEHATTIARALSGAEELVDTIARATGEGLVASNAAARAGIDRARLGKTLAKALKRIGAPVIDAAIAETMA